MDGAQAAEPGFGFDNSYVRDLPGFSLAWNAARVPAPRLFRLNRDLAAELGLDAEVLSGPLGAAWFSGNAVPPGAEPVAQAYAGHQFGGFSPQLGDGRALLLGEVIDRQGRRRDIALKGSGPTPFSRRGRWQGGAWAGAARIPDRRGDACAGHPDNARAGGGDDRRAGAARGGTARRRADPGGGEPYPGGHLPVLRGARRGGQGAAADPTIPSRGIIPGWPVPTFRRWRCWRR